MPRKSSDIKPPWMSIQNRQGPRQKPATQTIPQQGQARRKDWKSSTDQRLPTNTAGFFVQTLECEQSYLPLKAQAVPRNLSSMRLERAAPIHMMNASSNSWAYFGPGRLAQSQQSEPQGYLAPEPGQPRPREVPRSLEPGPQSWFQLSMANRSGLCAPEKDPGSQLRLKTSCPHSSACCLQHPPPSAAELIRLKSTNRRS